MKMRIGLILALVLLLLLPLSAEASEEIPIRTPEELAAISENPAGSYILMNDLDMEGFLWKSPDFSGTLDGNGHALLNLQLSQPGSSTPECMDGNNKTCPASYTGLFGSLVNATVKNLTLLNVQGLTEADTPAFLASMAGYCKDSTISGCTVSGTLELRAWDRMYGVGGLIGYGSGRVEDCKIDVTLICTDTDSGHFYEQFMGGVFAAGFVDVLDSQVHIQGYCSEYGYVHNGGIGGLYMQYPLAMTRPGYITGNQVSGHITFFEKNNSRRAYCEPYCGEILAHNYHIKDNTQKFLRDERKEYDRELRPESCPEPRYTETVIPSGCAPGDYGYTEYVCGGCGYTYRDRYTLLSHPVSSWTQTAAATWEQEGLSTGLCDQCGLPQQRREPRLPEPESQPAPLPEPLPPQQGPSAGPLPLAFGLLALAVIVLSVLMRKNRK